MTARVVIADDQEFVRAGFRVLLEDSVEVVGEAGDGNTAFQLAAELVPDVVLMDVRMPLCDGVEATARIVGAGLPTRIIILTTFDLDDYVVGALRAGASGFLLKDVRPRELLAAIDVVLRGDALLSPSVTRRLLDRYLGGPTARHAALAELTPRELEVLTLVAEALSNTEIAERLVLTKATVKSHVSAILRKLELRDRVQAVTLAYDVGLVRPRGSPSLG